MIVYVVGFPSQHRTFTTVHKHYSIEQWEAFAVANPDALEYVAVSSGISEVDWQKLQTILQKIPTVGNYYHLNKFLELKE